MLVKWDMTHRPPFIGPGWLLSNEMSGPAGCCEKRGRGSRRDDNPHPRVSVGGPKGNDAESPPEPGKTGTFRIIGRNREWPGQLLDLAGAMPEDEANHAGYFSGVKDQP
jgi:hypothetical protein